MNTKLFKYCRDEDELELFKKSLRNSKIVLDKIKNIVYNIRLESEATHSSDYDSASWPYKRADQDGYVRALKLVEQLLTIDPMERTNSQLA